MIGKLIKTIGLTFYLTAKFMAVFIAFLFSKGMLISMMAPSDNVNVANVS